MKYAPFLNQLIALLIILLAMSAPAAEWQTVDGTKIPTPPPEHPRLYLRAAQAAQIRGRLDNPTLKPLADRLASQAKTSPQARVEWNSIQYLATGKAELGRSTIEQCLDLLKKCELPDKQDACRVTGRMMVTGAIVYDWHHSLLKPEEKQAYIRELVRLARTQECGYPPKGQGSVTGHASEAMIMRDMLSAGIAIYDDFPEMYNLAAGRFFRDHLPVRNWFYPGHAYHQGDSYGAHRFSWDTFPLFIFDRLGAGNVYNPEQREVPYYWIYTTRPDGQRLRNGDTFASSARRGEPWSEYMGTLAIASYYKDPVLLGHHLTQTGRRTGDDLFDFLWHDIETQPKPADNLPLSRYFGFPFGWMAARTGWGTNAVVAQMKVNEYNFVNHQHLDAGEFQIYYKGSLATDSGVYSGSSGQYGSEHCQNYYWRTVAHNSLLIHDPEENFGKTGWGNDGGQRLPNGRSEARDLKMLTDPQRGYRTGKVIAHGFGPDPRTPDYTLLTGDITDAYSKKVQSVVRSFVFLNLRNAQVPAAMIVCDRVVSSNPAFRKYWLLHSMDEPQLTGDSATVDATQFGGQGRLLLNVLWPATDNLTLTKIGGPGKEYTVFGKNYPNDVPPDRVQRSSIELPAWRVEVSPKAPAAEDLLLNVMQVMDRPKAPGAAGWPVRRIETTAHIGCLLEGPDTSWLVLLRRDGQRSADTVEFAVPPARSAHVLVTGLAPGRWISRSKSGEMRPCNVTAESASAWFDAPAGTWVLSHQAAQ